VEAACEAVAALHLAWGAEAQRGPCPGVRNRLRILAEHEPLLLAGPNALPSVSPQLDLLLRRAVAAVGRLAPHAANALHSWAGREFWLQPCARDLRAEHVLFDGDRVTGIIDFGATAVDSPAVDLARLLGDYPAEGEAFFGAGLAAYRRIRGEFDLPDEFVRLLAQSGAVCSVLGWLTRLVIRREPAFDEASIHSRLAQLVGRLEQFPRA
jgi:homoserine kinase type II